jgi:hypothetical protein
MWDTTPCSFTARVRRPKLFCKFVLLKLYLKNTNFEKKLLNVRGLFYGHLREILLLFISCATLTMYEVKVIILVAVLSVHLNYVCLEKCWTRVQKFNHGFGYS